LCRYILASQPNLVTPKLNDQYEAMAEEFKTIQNVTDSVQDAVKARISHPVTGIFATTVLVFNWKGIFVLSFSTLSAEERIRVATSYWSMESVLLYPAIATIIYVIAAPILSAVVSIWVAWIERWRAAAEYVAQEDKTIALVKLAQKEKTELENVIAKKESELKILTERISGYREASIHVNADRRKFIEEATEVLKDVQAITLRVCYEPPDERDATAIQARFEALLDNLRRPPWKQDPKEVTEANISRRPLLSIDGVNADSAGPKP
jgi:hypothetical protein